jgi:hypothetical protein
MRLRPADAAVVRRSGRLAGTEEPRIELDLVDGTWLGPLSVSEAGYQALQTLLQSATVEEALVTLGGTEEQAAALDLARQALLRGLVHASPLA